MMRRSPAWPPAAVGLLAFIVCVLMVGPSGCAAAPNGVIEEPAVLPMWERPGLRGAVRPEMGHPQPGDAAPDFELPALGGGSVRLSSLRGSWVVVHFTATWCPYCDAEIVHLGTLADHYAARNVKVLVVDLQEAPEVWSAYARQRVGPSLVALQDRTGEAAARFAPPHAQPSFTDRAQVLFDATLLVDPAGILRVFLLPDTAHFDPSFAGVRAELDRQLHEWPAEGAVSSRSSSNDLLPPEEVVALSAQVTTLAADPAEVLVVRLAIAPGYHIMSDRPPDPFSIPTQVRAAGQGLEFGPPSYPAARVAGSLSVFDGAPEVRLPIRRVSGPSAGPIAVEVRYQACTETQCLAPVRKRIDVSL
jgi:peroxiredoxin